MAAWQVRPPSSVTTAQAFGIDASGPCRMAVRQDEGGYILKYDGPYPGKGVDADTAKLVNEGKPAKNSPIP